jgi:hypothetical protein
MPTLLIVAAILAACALIPAALFAVNIRLYQPPLAATHRSMRPAPTRIAVLIPARNEEANIEACVRSVLASAQLQGAAHGEPELIVLVLDDASTDNTAELVRQLALHDTRVRLLHGAALPVGWNGKQHACWLLAEAAQAIGATHLLFLDADVRLAPEAVARCFATLQRREVALLSGFPRQITVGWLEKLLLPLIHFVLLGLLPMARMRSTTRPAYAAGCGQFFLAECAAYFASGGHAAIRSTRHDGLRLPQAFRRAGLRTDLVDLTSLASVRMYDSAAAVWMGLAKNATEGLAAPARIVPVSLLLLCGQVLPIVAAALWAAFCVSNIIVGATFDDPVAAAWITALLVVALIASYTPRLVCAARFKQPWAAALLHPLGIVLLLCVQWYALVKQLLGQPIAWRARSS